MTQRLRIFFSGIVLFLGVGAGAFGAHALQALLSPREIETWKTAVLYHLIHGLGLLLVAGLEQLRPARGMRLAWSLMALGVLLFSGSLYLIVLTGARWIGPVTPMGGVAMMLAWLAVAWSGFRHWK